MTRGTTRRVTIATTASSAQARKQALLASADGGGGSPTQAGSAQGRAYSPKGRAGRTGVVIYLAPPAKDVLRTIAHEQRKTVQALGVDAFNLLFRAHGQEPIA